MNPDSDALEVGTIPHTKYNPKAVNDFLTSVFHTDLDEGEEVLSWMTTGIPGYPVTEEELETKLKRSKKPQALYYGTSTCRRAEDGHLYNRKALFCKLHVVVLDDIGTKIDKASLPPGLTPTYIIQSSEGNEQWGFVLKKPIDNLDHAQMLVTLVYHSGYTDTGGNMPTKLVRLPAGFNMKKGKEEMPVLLVSNDGPHWDPDDLLQVLETGVTWADIINRPGFVAREKLAKVQGATVWSPVHLEAPSAAGIIDPALEWLYEEGMVYQERGDWFDIRCPWCNEHSEGGHGKDRAGYSPMGCGEPGYITGRGFNCFHDSCTTRGPADFLEWMAGMGGPELPIHDYAPEMTCRYVYDAAADAAWDMQSAGEIPYRMSAVNNLHPHKVKVINFDGTVSKHPAWGIWRSNPARVVVSGAQYNPSTREKLFYDGEGDLYYNLFNPKMYDSEAVDKERLQPFYDFLEYLIPDTTEREYFTDWLACKVQDPAFRGAAMFMVAKQQGTGRNTLADMIGQMFGHRHVKQVPFNKIINNPTYNGFQESLFVVVNETMSIDDFNTNRRAAEALKEMVDPRPQLITVNPKYGRQRESWSVSSYLFLSNHDDGLKLTGGDRRFYAVRNAKQRADGDYFGMINDWIKNKGWEQHLWNDLLAREVNHEEMAQPPEVSDTMEEVIESGRSALDIIAHTYITNWPTALVPRKPYADLLATLSASPGLLPDRPNFVAGKIWQALLDTPIKGATTLRVGGAQHRVRVKPGASCEVTSFHPDWERTLLAIENYDPGAMLGLVIEALEDHEIDV